MKKLLCTVGVTLALAVPAAQAHQAGDFIVRVGSATVMPHESSDKVAGTNNEFRVNNDTQLGLNFGYMITDNFAVELLAATPFSHKVTLQGTGQIAKVKHLPPTLMAQYYLGESDWTVRPYAGVGINYTAFFSEKFTNNLDGALSDLSLKNSWGVAAQAGVDYMIDKNLFINASVWWMDIDTDVKFKMGGESQTVKMDIDPWTFMFSVGYSF